MHMIQPCYSEGRVAGQQLYFAHDTSCEVITICAQTYRSYTSYRCNNMDFLGILPIILLEIF